ncbi:MAG: proton-conducting transporter membrane subunit [Spirochaetes bacterium]|nr:proton-conducting transporter membrane subunit [Spirochaetota bacterium]
MNVDIYGNLFAAFILLFISAACAPFVAIKRKLLSWLNAVFVSLASIIVLYTSYQIIFEAPPQASRLINFGLFSIYFLVDGLSAFFLSVIAFMSIVSALYSIKYMEHYKDYSLTSYYVNYPLFVLGMMGIVTVDDLSLGFTISWQLMTIASFFLIRFEKNDVKVKKGANKYLVLMELAWLFIVIVPFLIPNVSFGDSLHSITFNLAKTSQGWVYAVFGLLLLGFGFKAGIFPFGQLWLPDAHSVAPSPISAMLSGVMIKTGVYGILRSFFWMVPHGDGVHVDWTFWGMLLASFGVATLFIGTVQSMKQNDAKRLLAYSSIGQIGYIVFAIGAGIFIFNSTNGAVKFFGAVAVIGAVYHVLNHAIFKGLLFLSSGSILYATGTKDLNKLGGLLKFMPVSALFAGIASLAISGVPPFSGFASKWTIISTAVLAGKAYLFLAIFGIIALFTSAITLSCYVKFFGMAFTSTGSEWDVKKSIHEVSIGMLFPKFLLAVLCLVQGLFPIMYYKLIIAMFEKSKGSVLEVAVMETGKTIREVTFGVQVWSPGIESVPSAIAVPIVVLLLIAVAVAFGYAVKSSGKTSERTVPAWLGGYHDLHNVTRYKNRSMFAAFKNALRWTGGNVEE